MRNAPGFLASFAILSLGCQPPAEQIADQPAAADTTPAVRQRVNPPDAFDGCYFQGQRFSIGAVKIQDGVLKKCIEEGIWHNVDGFGNLTPEDPSVEDTLSATATTASGQPVTEQPDAGQP